MSFSKFALGDHNLIIAPKQNDLSYDIKVKVTGLKDGVKFKWGWIGTTGYIDITTDGIHMLNKPAFQIRQLIVEFAEDFDPDHVVTIEQIPDYEGYLVTDGVDDIIVSKEKFATWQYFTIVGDWQFIIKEDKNSGVIIHGKLYCYNRVNGIWLYVNDSSVYNNLENVIKIRALSSDGKVYDENWNEIQIKTGGTENSNEPIQIAGHSQQSKYTRIAFKNIAIYNSLLSKEDCIKAYNYLQTLKSK